MTSTEYSAAMERDWEHAQEDDADGTSEKREERREENRSRAMIRARMGQDYLDQI